MPDPDKFYSDPDDQSVGERLPSLAADLSSPSEALVAAEEQCKDAACKKRQEIAEDLDITKMGYLDFIKVPREKRLALISDCQGVPVEGQKITFNFHGNKELRDTVGLAEMPYSIRVLQCGSNTYTRRAGGSFFGSPGYLYIGEKTQVVVKKIDPNYTPESFKADYRFAAFDGDPDVRDCALELAIDGRLLNVFLNIGVKLGVANDKASFLRRHGRFIQNRMMAYGSQAMDGDMYSRRFVRFVLVNDFSTIRDIDKYVNEYFNGVEKVAESAADVRPEPIVRAEPPHAIAVEPLGAVAEDPEAPVRIASVRDEMPPKIDKNDFLRVDDRVMVHPPDLEVVAPIVANMKRSEPLIRVDGRQYTHETPAQLFAYAEAIAASMGYRIGVTSGYRTVDQQRHIHEHAEDNEHNIMVASPGKSRHNYGAAMDVALYAPDKTGKLRQLTRLPDDKGKFNKVYAQILEQIMNRAGFVRYAAESWHYEAGSKEWAEMMVQRKVLPQDAQLSRYVYTLADVGRKPRKKENRLVAKYAGYRNPLMADNLEAPKPKADSLGIESMKDINELWRKRREIFQNELQNFTGQIVVENLPGNAGRPVGILVPAGTDLSKPVEIIYQFHGKNCEKFGQDPEADKAVDIFMAAASGVKGNVVFVYPLGPEYRKKYESKRQWFGKDSGDSMPDMHAQVLARLGVASEAVSKVTVKGHSAGGQAMMNMSKAGFTADRYDFEDASYGWAAPTYQAVVKNTPKDKKFEFNVFARTGTDTDPDARSLVGKPGVKVEWAQKEASHQGMVAAYFNYNRAEDNQSNYTLNTPVKKRRAYPIQDEDKPSSV